MSKTVTLKIEGMRCKGCAMGTQGALEKVAGVESAKVSFPDKQAVVVCADSGPAARDGPADRNIRAVVARRAGMGDMVQVQTVLGRP